MATFNPGRFSAGQLDTISGRNVAVRDARSLGIRVEGLSELRRTVRTLDRDALKLVQKGLKASMGPVVRDAQVIAPKKSGRLAASIRPFTSGNTVGVRSRLPYAAAIHWGGSVGKGHRVGVPWSGSVVLKPALFVSKAIERNEDEIIDAVGDVIEQTFTRF